MTARPAGPATDSAEELRLFCVFHANLDFSALPESDIGRVLDRCYAPLLQLCERARIPLGLEMPARTLQRIERDDPELLKTIRGLCERRLLEVVGSGYAQIVAPLAPVDVNRANLALGAAAYRELLGTVPTTWFVHEQTFAPGLGPLYQEVGARALVVEWNNPASHRRELRALRYQPVRLCTAAGGMGEASLPLLWNDSIVFQRLQRAVHGSVPVDDYLGFVRAARESGGRQLCAYGGDLEIFDYRPGAADPAGASEGREMARLGALLRVLASESGLEFALPADIAASSGAGGLVDAGDRAPIVELASPADPIPCKKQPRYNPTRWAVSGRSGLRLNTACFALRRKARLLEAAGGIRAASEDRTLVDLWRSDLRTRPTEEKLGEFRARLGRTEARLDARLAEVGPELRAGDVAVIWNPWDRGWSGEPVEVALRLPPGVWTDARARAVDARSGEEAPAQLDVLDRHRDGSLRSTRVLVTPQLGAGDALRIRLEPLRAGRACASPEEGDGPACTHAGEGPSSVESVELAPGIARTEQVVARFLPHRGGALASAAFRGHAGAGDVGEQGLIGSIPHGSFDAIAYTPDFYSGHAVLFCADGRKITNLERAAVEVSDPAAPLRIEVAFRVATPVGCWETRYRLYRDRPRIDVLHTLEMREVHVRSLRLGMATWLPAAYDRSSLRLRTVNGGQDLDEHVLGPGLSLDQARAVSPQVSASGCLGATEGWVAAGDRERGVALIGDRSVAALAPMVEFTEVDDRFLLRLFHSAIESDDTGSGFVRGVLRFPAAIVPHGASIEGVRATAGSIERGLHVRTAAGVEIAGGL